MLAPATKVKNRFPNNYVDLENDYQILKDAVIVGENAGGKSNFVRSLKYFKNFFVESDNVIAEKSTVNNNNIKGRCPRKSDSDQIFEIELTNKGGCIYKYLLYVDFMGIAEERLEIKDKKSLSYKNVFRITRLNNMFTCNAEEEECKLEECKISGSMSYQMILPGISDEIKKNFRRIYKKHNINRIVFNKISIIR